MKRFTAKETKLIEAGISTNLDLTVTQFSHTKEGGLAYCKALDGTVHIIKVISSPIVSLGKTIPSVIVQKTGLSETFGKILPHPVSCIQKSFEVCKDINSVDYSFKNKKVTLVIEGASKNFFNGPISDISSVPFKESIDYFFVVKVDKTLFKKTVFCQIKEVNTLPECYVYSELTTPDQLKLSVLQSVIQALKSFNPIFESFILSSSDNYDDLLSSFKSIKDLEEMIEI